MRKLIKSILPEDGVGDLKIRPRGDNRCESAKCTASELREYNRTTMKNYPSKITGIAFSILISKENLPHAVVHLHAVSPRTVFSKPKR